MILIKEDGSGRADANSYASQADADAYHDGHLYPGAWAAATPPNKDKALVFATRLIDAHFQFNGWRATEGQALQWPREGCPDPDRRNPEFASTVSGIRSGQDVAVNVVPTAVVNATCEMARELLAADRTSPPPGEGIDYKSDVNGTIKYSKSDTRPIISAVARAMLSRFGSIVLPCSGSVRLERS